MEGTAYTDNETPQMYESYQKSNEVYCVIAYGGVILGGGGIKPLKGFKAKVCEIKKMYFSPKVRGKGYGRLLF